jgi:hypothetical protein
MHKKCIKRHKKCIKRHKKTCVCVFFAKQNFSKKSPLKILFFCKFFINFLFSFLFKEHNLQYCYYLMMLLVIKHKYL